MESQKSELLSLRADLIKAADVALEARRKLGRLAKADPKSRNSIVTDEIQKEYRSAQYEVLQTTGKIYNLYQNNKSILDWEYPGALSDIKTAKCAAGLITRDDLEREERAAGEAEEKHRYLCAGLPSTRTAGSSYSDLLDTAEWRQRRAPILSRDQYRCQDCGRCEESAGKGTLQVHHKYYVRGRLPWNYLDDALITLCSDCHRKRHRSGVIFVYDEIDGKLVRTKMRPCIRCLGAGIFPQWWYYEDGICFRCRGAKFEIEVDAINEEMAG
jgi:5-methylcytosine-specific restriction endonuclease McrA